MTGRRNDAGRQELGLTFEAVRVDAVGAQPVALQSLGARFDDRADGEGRLRWRPRARDAGQYIFTIAGETPDGLVVRESFWVEV